MNFEKKDYNIDSGSVKDFRFVQESKVLLFQKYFWYKSYNTISDKNNGISSK